MANPSQPTVAATNNLFTPFGFKMLPFGIVSAPEHYQKRMSKILSGLDGVVCQMDDVLKDKAEHNTRLTAALKLWEQCLTGRSSSLARRGLNSSERCPSRSREHHCTGANEQAHQHLRTTPIHKHGQPVWEILPPLGQTFSLNHSVNS